MSQRVGGEEENHGRVSFDTTVGEATGAGSDTPVEEGAPNTPIGQYPPGHPLRHRDNQFARRGAISGPSGPEALEYRISIEPPGVITEYPTSGPSRIHRESRRRFRTQSESDETVSISPLTLPFPEAQGQFTPEQRNIHSHESTTRGRSQTPRERYLPTHRDSRQENDHRNETGSLLHQSRPNARAARTTKSPKKPGFQDDTR